MSAFSFGVSGFGVDSFGATPVPSAPRSPANLGYKVTFRTYSLEEMVSREWGPSLRAPDHRIYNWSNGRSFDSTDIGTTGIYKRGILSLQAEQNVPGTTMPQEFTMESLNGETGDPLLSE